MHLRDIRGGMSLIVHPGLSLSAVKGGPEAEERFGHPRLWRAKPFVILSVTVVFFNNLHTFLLAEDIHIPANGFRPS